MRPVTLPRPVRTPILLLLAGLLALACGGGGGSGGGDTSVGASTGSVAVLLTDGPVDPDQFSHIYVTFSGITLIGDAGQISIFDGTDTIDLRELEDASTVLTLGRDVPAGIYEKIRLEVTKIELVPANGGASIFPKLPPKIDLSPRGSFRVRAGELLQVQLDIDCGKSIHLVETGHGGFIFRPVIFVDILNGALSGKLVLLQGVVDSVGSNNLVLCDTHPVSRSLAASRTTSMNRDDDKGHGKGHGKGHDDGDDDDGEDDNDDDGENDLEDHCADVLVGPNTSIFDQDGDPAQLTDVAVGDTAWVLGRFRRDTREKLDFRAEVVQLGDDVLAVDGEVDSEVGLLDRFDLALDPGQGVVTDDGLLAIQLQDGTKIFARSGTELAPEDIKVGDPARAVGVLALSSTTADLLKAAWVMLDVEATRLERIEGEITSIMGGGAVLSVQTATEKECVTVPAAARVFAIHLSASGSSAEEIDRTKLMVGDEVNVFGSQGTSCFTADTVIVFSEGESPGPI